MQPGAIARPVHNDNNAEQVDLPQPAREPDPMQQRVTRGAAARGGIEVKDIPLPRHCPTSVRGRR